MLAEVRLQISPTEVRLTLTRNGQVVEDEIWKPERRISQGSAADLARVAFDDWYDVANYGVNDD